MNHDGPFLFDIRRIAPATDLGQAYNDLYNEMPLAQIESFYLWLLEHLDLDQGGSLLDVSCGSGEVVRLTSRDKRRAIGVDISEVVVRAARRTIPSEAAVLVGAGETLPFASSTFEYVTNIGSLEHFVDPALGVREMARVLKPQGRAFVLVPNTFSLLTNVWRAFRTGETAVDDQPIQRYGARADWVCLLEQNGLNVRRTIKYERAWPRVATDWQYYLHRPKELLRLVAAPWVPLNLAFCFLFVCTRNINRVD